MSDYYSWRNHEINVNGAPGSNGVNGDTPEGVSYECPKRGGDATSPTPGQDA